MALLLAVGYCHFKAFSKAPDTLSIRRLELLGLVACIGEKHRNGLEFFASFEFREVWGRATRSERSFYGHRAFIGWSGLNDSAALHKPSTLPRPLR